jgi:hypothetical protein
MFHAMASASTGKRKALVAMKFEIIQACESSNVSKSKIGRPYNRSSSTLFMILKNRNKIRTAVLRDNVHGGNKKVRGTDHSEFESALFQWFSQKHALGMLNDEPRIKEKASKLSL